MKRPNVLFIFSDDQRFDTVHALGNEQIKTPFMDALTERGVSFTNAHIMGGLCGAVCIPSRAMTLTGRSLFHITHKIDPAHTTLPQALGSQGYETFVTGKWHSGKASLARSFSGGDKIFFGGMTDQWRVPVHEFDPSGVYPKDKEILEQRFSSEIFTDAAVEFLRNRKGEDPFFLYAAYTAPHDPRTAPKEFLDLYDPSKLPLPPNFLPEHPFDNGELKVRDELLAPFPRTPEAIQRHLADYYAMISSLDAQIQRILTVLAERGWIEDTIVVFAGDNGLALGQHGLMGKQNVYEHSVHVPLIMAGPGLPSGVRCDRLCMLLDIFPTLCELTGTVVPGTVEGLSLMPAIREDREVRDHLFFAYREFQRSVRDRRHKLIEYQVNGQRTTQFFDLKEDPWETRNLSEDPHQKDRVAELRKVLVNLQQQLGDPVLFI